MKNLNNKKIRSKNVLATFIATILLASVGTMSTQMVDAAHTPTVIGNYVCTTEFSFKIDAPTPATIPPIVSGTYSDSMFSVDITATNDDKGVPLNWNNIPANTKVKAVALKGGQNSHLYLYPDPGATSDTGLVTLINTNNNKFFALSNIVFCYDKIDLPPPPPPQSIAEIHGKKVIDANADGDITGDTCPDAADDAVNNAGCEGVTINLSDGPSAPQSTVTNGDGEYWFMDLIPGTYKVTVSEPLGFFCSFPDPCEYEETLESGDVVEDRDFGDHFVIRAEKSWTKTDYNWDPICDDNLDGIPDEPCVTDLRPRNINNPFDNVLADPLPLVGEKYVLKANLQFNKKANNYIFQNTNPGAFFALTTVNVDADIDRLKVWEMYIDCTTNKKLIQLLAPADKPVQAVKVAIAAPNGDITELTGIVIKSADGSSAHIEIEGPIQAGSTVYALVKFQDALQKMVVENPFDRMCDNTEKVIADIDGELPPVIAEASLRITNQI